MEKLMRELISKDKINARLVELGKMISERNKDSVPIIIGVLNGSFLFMADLVRNLDVDFEVDFIKISSYGNSKISSGKVKLVKDMSADISNRDVIIVEDIVDTGLSLEFLKHRLEEMKPKSLQFATLLYKKDIAQISFDVDYIGFEIEDKFVVGYGLDYNQKMRGLPSIFIMDEE
jgi:hypoxanthine phosphoribosyltransferase